MNLGCVDLNPHPVQAEDLDHPDELRIDLDPVPGVAWAQIVDVALVVREVLEDHGLVGWPKTSGSRGFHIYARIEPRWTFRELRRAAETVAREVENRAPDLATSTWWKEERHGVFVDFNQNAKDRTVASAYSVRAAPRRPGVDAAALGRGARLPARGVHPARRCPQRYRRRSATRGRASTTPTRLAGRAARARRVDWARRRSRRRGTGRRQSTMPLIEIARAKTKPEALEGARALEGAAPGRSSRCCEPADVLVDGMRGSSSLWYRIRVNLQHVPEDERPAQEPLEVDYDPWAGRVWPGRRAPRRPVMTMVGR